MFMIIYILDDISHFQAIVSAWRTSGASGITIFDTTGTETLHKRGYRDDLPLMPSIVDLLSEQDAEHKTLMTIVESEAIADRIVQVTQEIVGDFSRHNAGVLCVLPVLKAFGLNKLHTDD